MIYQPAMVSCMDDGLGEMRSVEELRDRGRLGDVGYRRWAVTTAKNTLEG